MRGFILGAVLLAAFLIFGCGSSSKNPLSSSSSDPAFTGAASGLGHPPDSTRADSTRGNHDGDSTEADSTDGNHDEDSTETDSLRGFFGKVSDLNSGAFTLTSPSGRTMDVTTDAETRVIYKDSTTSLADSPLKNGDMVSAQGFPTGTKEHPSILARWIVINNRPQNRLVAAD